METLSGLGKTDRKRITAVIRSTKGTISVKEVANILDASRIDAAKMLSRWAAKGWVSRVRRGLYVLVPLASLTSDVALEEPWIIAERLYAPCYIGGWSAAEYWGLTEQIFRSVLVLTCRKPQEKTPIIKNTKFFVRKISEKSMFGLKPVWKGKVKVSVSDPSRTVIDMLSDPTMGGGIRPTVDVFSNYSKSEFKDMNKLIDYANKLGNGAVLKRLGFLLERFFLNEEKVISACKAGISKGNAKLDPSLPSDKLITRWRLWVPENWTKEDKID